MNIQTGSKEMDRFSGCSSTNGLSRWQPTCGWRVVFVNGGELALAGYELTLLVRLQATGQSSAISSGEAFFQQGKSGGEGVRVRAQTERCHLGQNVLKIGS